MMQQPDIRSLLSMKLPNVGQIDILEHGYFRSKK